MRNLSSIKKNIHALKRLFKGNPAVIAAYIFGSCGTKDQTDMSDIDAALLFDRNIPLVDELALAAKVSSALERDDVDIEAMIDICNHIISRK
ncbi:MAG: nucleotidyltransferase domain-containing protein [Bacillota bacterium]